MAARVTLLGPQRSEPTLKAVVDSLGFAGRLAAVTAGWEEREGEDQELRDHLGRRLVNLRIHERGEDVYAQDPEFFGAMRARHDHLRRLQELYRVRLSHELAATRALFARRADPAWADLIEPACEEALEGLRNLDRRHLAHVAELHADFEARWQPTGRAHITRHRREIAAELADCEAVCIAGGHVTVLLNRVRMLGLLELCGDLPLVAWSAGAMILCERVVLFHDSPPQGAGNAEVLETGLGACPGLVALPHADKRLALEDRARVELFARRFQPDVCALLVHGARLEWNGHGWCGYEGSRSLGADGGLADVGLCEVRA